MEGKKVKEVSLNGLHNLMAVFVGESSLMGFSLCMKFQSFYLTEPNYFHFYAASANIWNNSVQPTDPTAPYVGRYLRDLRKQMSAAYRLANHLDATLKVKGRKGSDGEEFLIVDEMVNEIHKGIVNFIPK